MKKKHSFLLWLLSFAIIASLCVLNRQPLIFHPIDYGIGQFLALFFLLGILMLGLTGVLNTLAKIRQKIFTKTNIYIYYEIGALGSLFIFTLFAGFVESLNPFLYYFCVSNSCIYLLSGYSVTLLAAFLFAREELTNSQETEQTE